MNFPQLKNITLLLSCAALAALNSSAFAKPPAASLEPAWTIEGIDTPESVIEVVNKRQNYFLVSAIEGDFFIKDGKGSLVKINNRGEVLDMNWVSGLNAPKGMAQFKDKVYVADIDEVVVIDINSAKIIEKIAMPGAILLNDIAADARGTIYISDTFAGRVYRLKDRQAEVYLEGIANANGLWAEHDRLLVGAGKDILAFDTQKQSTIFSGNFPLEIDGITPWRCNSYLVSSWEGQILSVSKKGEQTVLLDSIAEGINTADIMYSEKSKLLFVPNFFHNTVSAYRVKSGDNEAR
jgi:hypothetical protein